MYLYGEHLEVSFLILTDSDFSVQKAHFLLIRAEGSLNDSGLMSPWQGVL